MPGATGRRTWPIPTSTRTGPTRSPTRTRRPSCSSPALRSRRGRRSWRSGRPCSWPRGRLTGPRLILLGLAFFGLMEIGAATSSCWWPWPSWPASAGRGVGLRPLTKVTPGVGLVWFAVRREWRSLAIAATATAVVVAVSAAVAPGAWAGWIGVSRPTRVRAGPGLPCPCPWSFASGRARPRRLGSQDESPLDRSDRLDAALPALWYGGLSITLAALPLLGVRSGASFSPLSSGLRNELVRDLSGLRPRKVGPGRRSIRPDEAPLPAVTNRMTQHQRRRTREEIRWGHVQDAGDQRAWPSLHVSRHRQC